ncbi:hypothetical protein DID88_010306 [Monilinia fructigena]|uniref:Uncharacterized protein n=1 Tax=Monilinia fructigena TaxID=38457 RepID=A0A395ILS1_9HELO|nr:hypothetical protein DID88_010306 [Monilinia fructigena]
MDSHDIPSLNDPHAVPTDPYRGRAQPIHNLPIKVEAHEEDIPTDSHALAIADHDEKGAAQVGHGNVEVRDLGWSDESHEVPTPLVGEPPLGGLDLNIADEEEFSPDKLRAKYRAAIYDSGGRAGELLETYCKIKVMEGRDRTVIFASVYFLAWLIDFLVPTIIGKYQGEAVEQEASNFVNSFASIAISSAAGKHPQGDPHGDEAGASTLEDATPDPTQMAVSAADAKDSNKLKAAAAGAGACEESSWRFERWALDDPAGPIRFPSRYKGDKEGWWARLEEQACCRWATSREIADGILIIDKAGEQKQLTANLITRRAFQSLISMGAQNVGSMVDTHGTRSTTAPNIKEI